MCSTNGRMLAAFGLKVNFALYPRNVRFSGGMNQGLLPVLSTRKNLRCAPRIRVAVTGFLPAVLMVFPVTIVSVCSTPVLTGSTTNLFSPLPVPGADASPSILSVVPRSARFVGASEAVSATINPLKARLCRAVVIPFSSYNVSKWSYHAR